MLFPKNIIYKKLHRVKNNNLKKKYVNFLNFASFAIRVLECTRLSSKLLSIILFKTHGVGKKIGKIWLTIFPSRCATRKKEKVRMGKGAGAFFRWFCFLKIGQVIFEFEALNQLSASLLVLKLKSLFPVKLSLSYI